MSWGFLWIMVGLKIPLAALILLVWWAIRQKPSDEESSDEGDGGIRLRRVHPRTPFPRRPRRGPHGDPAPAPPARVRTVRARARTLGH
ncbi:MAG: hypothetical protein ACYCXW_22975 [Solirubrobacteraceae bacterium]